MGGRELSLQTERNSSRHQRYSSDHIHALGVSIEEVASATIIAVIKSRPAKNLLHLKSLTVPTTVNSLLSLGYHGKARDFKMTTSPSLMLLVTSVLEDPVGQKFIILLGLRASLKEDILCTPAELVFWDHYSTAREMFDSSKPDDDVANFV
ncbi:hypothetical protein TNCV_2000151 [Trichonephila clavipes]|nr:hypothetical protein TNCV_2000151 [Trichonephila clavipes]